MGVSTNLFDLFGHVGEGPRPATPEPKRHVEEPGTRRRSRSRSRSVGRSSMAQRDLEPAATSVETANAVLMAATRKAVANVDEDLKHACPTADKLRGMKLVDLKTMCKAKGLAQDGSKTKLLELILASNHGSLQNAMPPSEAIAVGEEAQSADAVEALMTREDLEDMKTVGLKKLCLKRSLPQTGSRKELLERLSSQFVDGTPEQKEITTQQRAHSKHQQAHQTNVPLRQEFSRMKQSELKGLCSASGLEENGTKASLVNRLVEEKERTMERSKLPGTPPDQVPPSGRSVRRRHSSKGPEEASVLSPDPSARFGTECKTRCGLSTGRRRFSSKGPEHSLLLSPEPQSVAVMPAGVCAAVQPVSKQMHRKSKDTAEVLLATPRPVAKGGSKVSLSEIASRVERPSSETVATARKSRGSSCTPATSQTAQVDIVKTTEVPKRKPRASSAKQTALERPAATTPVAAKKSHCAFSGSTPEVSCRVSDGPVVAMSATDKKPRGSSRGAMAAAGGHVSERPDVTTPATAKKSRGSARGATPDTARSRSTNPALSRFDPPVEDRRLSVGQAPKRSSTLAALEPTSQEASTASKRQRVGNTSVLDLKAIIESSTGGGEHKGWAAFAARRHGA